MPISTPNPTYYFVSIFVYVLRSPQRWENHTRSWLPKDKRFGGLATVHTYCNDLARIRTAGGDENDASAIHDGWRYDTRSF
ncbi:unnamed protein product [Leptosia nina]|uniref:Uncharacterized protein n=1 Tax=Leptosia nina TaxID=320188 RepID=A0AAV1JT24_9NEOP